MLELLVLLGYGGVLKGGKPEEAAEPENAVPIGAVPDGGKEPDRVPREFVNGVLLPEGTEPVPIGAVPEGVKPVPNGAVGTVPDEYVPDREARELLKDRMLEGMEISSVKV